MDKLLKASLVLSRRSPLIKQSITCQHQMDRHVFANKDLPVPSSNKVDGLSIRKAKSGFGI